jgi:exocyst complex component 4
MTQAFETLLKQYQQLADLVLFTLRLEIRLRTMHYLDKASRDGVYQLTEDIAEPDPAVVDLNMSLAEFDECAAATLAPVERRFVNIFLRLIPFEFLLIMIDDPAVRFIFEGLSLFMDHLLISNSRHIRLANINGLTKMIRNILALQQNLKNIGDSPLEVNFDRSRKFWEVFGRGPSVSFQFYIRVWLKLGHY